MSAGASWRKEKECDGPIYSCELDLFSPLAMLWLGILGGLVKSL